jgi:hypothetical protein
MTRFKVVKLTDLLKLPTGWQWPGNWHEEFREKFEAALNRMSKEGWLYVDKFDWEGTGSLGVMIVFRNEPQLSPDPPLWITDVP